MPYEVLARKWRPKQFAEVVGQDHVTGTLANALAADRVAHAYLFVGPRGTGKTTLARLLAKALNCGEGPSAEPCDACPSCKEILGGSSLDVIEIDGASNNGVEQIRDLRDKAAYTPARGPYKIYIIDEVHMLSIGAFNALLKILEEPPRHVKFFFATTEPHKVPATILSRCQRFDLKPIPLRLLVEHLGKVAQAEGVDADAEALLAVARGAEGGLRDALSALDQLISFRGNTLREDDVMAVFGLAARRTLDALAEAILAGDPAAAVRIVAELDAGGKDMQRVVVEMIEHFRNLLICSAAGGSAVEVDVLEDRRKALVEQAARADTPGLLRIIDLFSEAEQRLRFGLSRRTLMEVAVIRASRATQTASVEDIIRQLNLLKKMLGAGDSEPDPGRGGASEASAPPAAAAQPERNPSSGRAVKPLTDEEALALLQRQWGRIVETVGRAAPLARSSLRDARPAALSENRVTIAFDPEFAEEQSNFESSRNRRVLQSALRDALGRDVSVAFTVGPAPSPPANEADEASDGPASQAGESPPRPLQRNMTPQAVRTWTKEPAVRKVLETFQGDIVDIRE